MAHPTRLTAREEYLLFSLATWQEDYSELPTRADIAEAMGVTPGRATQLVASLETKGMIERRANKSRGISFTADGRRLAFEKWR